MARKGDPAPGIGGAIFKFFGATGGFGSTPALDDAGNTAFFADLSGLGVTFFNNHSIWSSNTE